MKTISALGALLGLALALATIGGAAPQAPPDSAQTPPAADQAVPVFGVESSVVLLDVIVRDKKGHLVKDLTASDFEVSEDGQKQTVSAFRIIDGGLDRIGSPSPAAGVAAAAPPAAAQAAPGGLPAAAEPLPAGEAPASPAVIAFLFDRLSTEARDNAHKAALAYATRGHVDGDVVGVFSLDLALRTLQPFTKDLAAVRAAFDRAAMQAQTPYANVREAARDFNEDARRAEAAIAGLTAGGTGGTDASTQTTAGSMAVQREFALMQAGMLQSFDRLERDQQGFSATNGLMAMVSGLQALPGRKTIVFFSEGLTISSNVLSQFRSAIATANRANVTVYAIDAGGLRTLSTTKEAREELVARANTRLAQEGRGYIDGSDGALTRGQERAEDMLRLNPKSGLGQLAEETGGFLVADTNDTARGFQRIQEEMRFYYLLSYSPTDPSFDGRFRTISLKVARPGLEVHTRKGYLAVRSDTSVPVRTFEGPALAQLDRQPRPNDFPLTATALSFPESTRPGRVPVMVQFPGNALAYEPDKDGKLCRAQFSVVARLRDAQGHEVDRLSRDYPLTVPADKVEAAKRGDVLYFQETDLRPGRYTLEAVAWDSLAKKASVRTATVDVPGFAEGALRLSSLVLLKRVEKLTPAEQGRDNPLYFGEMILYPNMGEPFRKSVTPNLAFYFTAYGSPGDAAPRQALVELLKGNTVAAKLPMPLPAADAGGRIQQAATLPMQALAPGDYTLKVTVASATQSASRQTRFVVAE
jgi:VWFA-related protein